MCEYYIYLKPVYSGPATETQDFLSGVQLPENWRLSWHQVETIKALRDPNIDVVVNVAMAGDGKSLAAYLDTIYGQSDALGALGLYPTNELARDQYRQLQGYIEKFKPEVCPRVNQLSGPELEIYADNEGLRKSDAIATRTGQSDILLSNPDIFHYLHRGAYLTGNDNPDKLWGRIDLDFDLFIFDEFHIFVAPQVASVLNTMLLIRHTKRQKKFLFLSATPNDELIARLEAANFRCCLINPLAAGKYLFPDTEEQEKALKAEQWRPVTRGINLNFIELKTATSSAAETWLKASGNLILDYFRQYPGSQGAIILNSIASVKRLIPFFHELFASAGLTVGENTGLSGKKKKERSLACDLVLGTSTIDVGVDFKINLLIFESADAGNFIQRLGRLGRHDGFERFTAYALCPKYLIERLFLGESPALESGGIYDRAFFHEQIREKYRQINDFRGYYRRWGAVQSLKISYQLSNPIIKQQYQGSQQAFAADAQRIFQTKLNSVAGRMREWAQEWEQLSGKKGNPIVEDASSFRGSSPLQCGIYDLTEPEEGDRFKTYDLPGILSNLTVEPMTKTAFLRELQATVDRTGQPIAKGRFEPKHCLAFVKLQSYREERLNWKFTYSGDLQPVADAWKVQVLTGVEVWQPDNPWIREINQKLKKQPLVSYVLGRPLAEVRARLRLPMHFQIYPICDRYSIHDSTPPYAIAFGQSALLVDTLADWFKGQGGNSWIC